MEKVLRRPKSISLPHDMVERIEEMAVSEDRSFANMVEVILKRAMNEVGKGQGSDTPALNEPEK